MKQIERKRFVPAVARLNDLVVATNEIAMRDGWRYAAFACGYALMQCCGACGRKFLVELLNDPNVGW